MMDQNRNKIIVAIVLFIVLGVVFFYQLDKIKSLFPQPRKTVERVEGKIEQKPKAKGAKPQAPDQKEALTAEGTQEGEPKPNESNQVAEKPSPQTQAESTRPKQIDIEFFPKEVEQRYSSSRFFARNDIGQLRDPFIPPSPSSLLAGGGGAKPFGIFEQMTGEQGAQVSGATGAQAEEVATEIPLLPLPQEPLGPPIVIQLKGISKGSQSVTALFQITDESGKVLESFLARPGWVVGQDYIFIGISDGSAKLLDRKTNSVILLSIGGKL